MPLTQYQIDPFPSVTDKNAYVYHLLSWAQKTTYTSIQVEYWIAIVGIFLTIFHLIVLIKLRSSSIVSIMIGMAICDLIFMTCHIFTRDMILYFFGGLCTPPQSKFMTHIFLILLSIRDDVVRCSSWLSVVMASVRYLILKNFSKAQYQRLVTFNFGIHASIVSFVVSSVFSVGFYLSVEFEQTGIWRPALNCTNVPLTMEAPIFEQRVSVLFEGTPQRVFQLVNGSATKIIPCILLPLLTALLALEVRKAQKIRNNTSVLYKNNTEKTTILVIIMTSLLFIAYLPTGIATVFQVVLTDLGYLYLSIFINVICNGLLLIIDAMNCFICFAMSGHYRKSVREVLHIPEPKIVHSAVTSVWRTTI